MQLVGQITSAEMFIMRKLYKFWKGKICIKTIYFLRFLPGIYYHLSAGVSFISFSLLVHVFISPSTPPDWNWDAVETVELGVIYVNSATIFHLRSSHLQFTTPLPPPTFHLLKRLHALNTINNLNEQLKFFVQ